MATLRVPLDLISLTIKVRHGDGNGRVTIHVYQGNDGNGDPGAVTIRVSIIKVGHRNLN